MAGTGQFKRATAARWTSVNPTLAIGELGLETDTNKAKMGDGVTAWNGLPYAFVGPIGPGGPPGTGLSRVTASTLTFSNEDPYVEATINDALIASNSIIQVQVLGEEFIIQNVTAGYVSGSIVAGASYKIYGRAPDGATGVMSVNILIF